jgi:hypothetical protein
MAVREWSARRVGRHDVELDRRLFAYPLDRSYPSCQSPVIPAGSTGRRNTLCIKPVFFKGPVF